MSPYFATHAGMLGYVAREFNALARAEPENTKRFALYATILERMIDELDEGGASGDASGRDPA
jgi:hypothetical protein